MATILRISDATALAFHALARLALAEEGRQSATRMAADLKVSEAHLAKVLQRLARAGLVKSTRGPGGGFVLGRPAGGIRMMEVYTAVEGAFREDECLLGRARCGRRGCLLGQLVRRVNREVRDYLESTRLSDVAGAAHRNTATKQERRAKDVLLPV